LQRAITGLTIPHDLDDLKSLPVNCVCQIDAQSSLKFSASVTYNVLNDPLATTAVSNLPSIAVNATAGATVEATATHTSDHTLTIAKVRDGLIHLSVSLTRTDDLETSLTVSAGATAKVGNTDAVAFLLGLISPNSTTELKKIQTEMPADQFHQLGSDIKSAIDASLSSSLQVSLKAALDSGKSRNLVFLYEINLNALDGDSTAALQSAMRGDFTAVTKANANLTGIRVLDNALTLTSQVQHTLTLHLLGIFNWSDTNTFIRKSKVDYTKDTHEIVLSDEAIHVVTNNLSAEKLRQVVLKSATLTIPASANTPAATNPVNLVYFDRQAGVSASKLRQFANVLQAIGAAGAAGPPGGVTSLFLGLNLTPPQCRQLFIDGAGKPYGWTEYLRHVCDAQAVVLRNDPDNADRFRLYAAGEDFWKQLQDLGAGAAQVQLLKNNGIRESAYTDVTTTIWWAFAMEDYAKAVAGGKSLEKAGKEVVKDSTRGFSEPWMVLAVWLMLGRPAIQSKHS